MSQDNAVIYVVDDDESVLEALSSLVRSIGLDVECYSSTSEFFNNIKSRDHGCLILDVRMPEMSGLDVQKKLSSIGDDIPIIFISGHGDIPMAVKAIKEGAVDFLTKPFREEELLNAIRSALRLDAEKCENSTEIKAFEERYGSLSIREKQVLSFVLEGRLNKQTAAELGISEATVKVHRHNFMKKIGAESIPELVRIMERIEVSSSKKAGKERPF